MCGVASGAAANIATNLKNFWIQDVHIHLCFNNTIACPYKNVVMKKTMLLVGLDLCSTFLNTLSVFTLCDLTRILCKGEM